MRNLSRRLRTSLQISRSSFSTFIKNVVQNADEHFYQPSPYTPWLVAASSQILQSSAQWKRSLSKSSSCESSLAVIFGFYILNTNTEYSDGQWINCSSQITKRREKSLNFNLIRKMGIMPDGPLDTFS